MYYAYLKKEHGKTWLKNYLSVCPSILPSMQIYPLYPVDPLDAVHQASMSTDPGLWFTPPRRTCNAGGIPT